MKLMGRIFIMAMAPIITATIVINLVLQIRITDSIESKVKDSLLSVALMERENISIESGNQYHVDNEENLWNGDKINITNVVETQEQIKQDTNIDVAIFYDDTCYMSTIENADTPMLGTKADSKVIEKVLKNGEIYFSKNIDVLGSQYYGLYIPYYEEVGKEPVGIIFSGTTRECVKKEISDATLMILVIMIVIALLFGVEVFFLTSKITKRLRYGVRALEELKNGNLTEVIDKKAAEAKDESGEIVQAVQAVQEQLVSVVSKIADNSKNIYQVSTRMNEGMKDTMGNLEQVESAVVEIAEGATSQANDTQHATENILTIGKLIQETKDNVSRLSKNADSMEQNGYEAGETLKKLEGVNVQVKEAIDTIYEQTNNTNESAQKIAETINIITSIAEETNLLALNASIEAARAGEQGKGFAVVASQIQSLAEQSNSSAMQIGDSIAELRNDSETAVVTMEKVRSIMLEQNDMVMKTDEKFREMLHGIEVSRSDIGDIFNNTRELDGSKEQVIDVVQSLSAISEEYVASTEETSASVTEANSGVQEIVSDADYLQKIAGELEESVKIFQV